MSLSYYSTCPLTSSYIQTITPPPPPATKLPANIISKLSQLPVFLLYTCCINTQSWALLFFVFFSVQLSASYQCRPLGSAVVGRAMACVARIEVCAERGRLDIGTGSVLGHFCEEAHDAGNARLAKALHDSNQLVHAGNVVTDGVGVVCDHELGDLGVGGEMRRMCGWACEDALHAVSYGDNATGVNMSSAFGNL